MAPPPFNPTYLSSPGFRVGVSVERRAELERANRLKQEQYAKQKTIQFSNLLERTGEQIEEYVESQRNLFLVEAPSGAERETSSDSDGFADFNNPNDYDAPDGSNNLNNFDSLSNSDNLDNPSDLDNLDNLDNLSALNDSDVSNGADDFDALLAANETGEKRLDDAFGNANFDAFDPSDVDFDPAENANDRRGDDFDDFFDPADDVFFNTKPFYRYDHSNSFQEDLAFDPTARSSTSLRDHLAEQLRLDGRCADLPPRIWALCEKIIDRLDADGRLTVDALETPPLTNAEFSALKSEFDAIFDVDASPESVADVRTALDELAGASSKNARDAARRRLDAAVGRKTTADEREKAKTALESFVATKNVLSVKNAAPLDPLDALFPKKPSKKERDAAEKALAVVQTLDPPGVGARSLQESLLLRVRDDLPNANLIRRVVAEAFDDFQKKRVSTIAEKTGIPFSDVAAIYEAGFPFHPAPGSLFSNEPTRLIRPEIFLDRAPSGRWLARLDDARPEFRVDPLYRKMLLAKNVDKATKEYLRRQYVDATALLDALQSRDSTVLRVAQAAVDFQNDYLDDAEAAPRPLTLRQVADKIGLDPSTVSRACVDKWIATPRGFVALKSLFPKAVSGDAASAGVESRIRELIDGEETSAPLSDDALAAELLRRFQIAVSRKTVQEYRERLQIPNSRARKRLFQERVKREKGKPPSP